MDTKELTVDCISDTHERHRQITLPGGDILIHAGDCSMIGQVVKVLDFLNWFEAQDYTHKIFIPGNHDLSFEDSFPFWKKESERRGIILLNDSGCEVEGIKIWGSPIQPAFCDWAFNRERGADIKRHWDLIPDDTDVLVTHGPPYKILDLCPDGTTVGCVDLLKKIQQTKIKLHVFGHIHMSQGHEYVGDKTYVNASSVDEQYRIIKNPYTRVIKLRDNSYLVDQS